MSELGSIDSIVAALDPTSVGRFLTKRGYTRTGTKPGVGEIYENASGILLALPLNPQATDYARRLRDLLDVFTDHTTPIDDVVGAIVLPDSDVFRYRIETAETAWGRLRLSYTHEAMHALYDVFMFSAAGVSSGKTDYRRPSDAAHSFAQQCQFGQTEYGSFVMKVFCPTKPAGVPDTGATGEPFGRQSTRAVLENFSFLARDEAEDPSEPLPPTMNRQVASAIHRLQPPFPLGMRGEVSLRFAPLPVAATILEPTTPQVLSPSLRLTELVYSRAQRVRDRLKKAEEFDRELLRGFIVALHKDRPLAETEQSHEIRLDVKAGAVRRVVRLRLLPNQYHRAVQWHDSNTEVDLDGVIDKRSSVWTVASLYDLKPVAGRPRQFGLFDPVED